MKKSDRRNKTLQKIQIQQKNRKETLRRFTKNEDFYKSVLFISSHGVDPINKLAGDKIIKINEVCGNVYRTMCIKTENNILIVNGRGLNHHNLVYASKNCGATVLFYGNEADFELIEIFKSFSHNFLICCLNKTDVNVVKRMLKNTKIRVIDINNLLSAIMLARKTDRNKRPTIIPHRFFMSDSGNLVCEASLESGIVSRNFMLNGVVELEVEEIIKNGIYKTDIFQENEDVKFNFCYKADEILDSENIEETDNFEGGDELSIENDSGEEEKEIDSGLRHKYKDFKTRSEIESENQELPIYYKDLVFIDKVEPFEGACRHKYKKIFVGEAVVLKFKKTEISEDLLNFVCLTNIFPVESSNTIYNIKFSSKEPIMTGENIIVDFGFVTFSTNALVSDFTGGSVNRVVKSGTDGLISFIKPLMFNISKISLYRGNNANLIEKNNYLGSGLLLNHSDIIYAERHDLLGAPLKISKRVCVLHKMFDNKEDVLFFKNFELRSMKFNTGFIKEPMGTHGNFKAFFTNPIKHGDKVTLSVYKRVFPLI